MVIWFKLKKNISSTKLIVNEYTFIINKEVKFQLNFTVKKHFF